MTETPAAAARYAIYFAPAPGSPWRQFGADWLGRGEGSDAPVDQFDPPPGIARDQWCDMIGEPRRYGFHAALKAPFRMVTDRRAGDLEARLFAHGLALLRDYGYPRSWNDSGFT